MTMLMPSHVEPRYFDGFAIFRASDNKDPDLGE